MFPVTSRYHLIETKKMTTAVSQEVIYLKRRFLPDVSSSITLTQHTVTAGERLDNITAVYLGDPEQFWRLGDANSVMHPNQLTAEIDKTIDIPIIQGAG
ncbi:MAG: LysM domain-containing protein [Chloroflexi bacterium]|nr:MAG: LysM domain-containing protein [Chloroflexota bacterium]